ncbi:inactive protein tyrosine kinase pTKL-like [Impatiens glandulifera]|uniref:inactive protein tyrosine kinase pTKL-like n=1 Tax=Impatiens glandulifera TaxID=253017 RepID=UPI001FB08E4A|nr:inactive protein tyrosine kinase pTKL-like [Impatiens glandulifera]
MAHGGYGKRTFDGRKPAAGSIQQHSKGLGVDKKSKPNVKGKGKTKPRSASFKNQIRSVERLLQKDIPPEIREAQMKKLEELKKQQDTQSQLSVDIQQKKKKLSADNKIFLRYKMVRFFERRKIDRKIKRLEKSQLDSSDPSHGAMIAEQLRSLKEDLEYVRFFPKTEKYVSLFMGGDNTDIVKKINILREQIKANIAAAAASGKNLEETGGEDDGILDVSDDDFFLNGNSSDEADADADELKIKSTRVQTSNSSRKPAASGLSNGKRNHKQISAQAKMPLPRPTSSSFSNSARSVKPPPRPTSSSFSNSARAVKPPPRPTSSSFSNSAQVRVLPSLPTPSSFSNSAQARLPPSLPTPSSFSNSAHGNSNFGGFTSKKPVVHRAEFSAPSYTSNAWNGPSFGNRAASDVGTVGLSSNVSSSSEIRKPRRKRRAKKKKQEN